MIVNQTGWHRAQGQASPAAVRRARWVMHWASVGLLALLAGACTSKDAGSSSDRGAGLEVASLPASERASAYAAAVREAFDVGPGLVLLLDPDVLPSARSGKTTHELPADVIRRLRGTGVIQGTCQPRSATERRAPICTARSAGYVIRLSDIFRIASDSVQLYLTAERYRPSQDSTRAASPLRLEQRYNLARHGNAWVVATKERLVL